MAVSWQPRLLDLEPPSVDAVVPVRPTWLHDRCWVDQAVDVLRSSGQLFDRLAADLPWRQKTHPVLFVGGNEPQEPYQAHLDAEIAERYGGQVTVEWFFAGWSSNWPKVADSIETTAAKPRCRRPKDVRADKLRAMGPAPRWRARSALDRLRRPWAGVDGQSHRPRRPSRDRS